MILYIAISYLFMFGFSLFSYKDGVTTLRYAAIACLLAPASMPFFVGMGLAGTLSNK